MAVEQNPYSAPVAQGAPVQPPAAPKDVLACASVQGILRRLIAFAVDFAVLAVLGWIAMLALRDLLVAAYPWTRLVGLPAIVLYRGLFQARYGRTPGQRLLGIRVADRRGHTPTLLQAIGRNTLLTTPMVLNNFSPPGVPLTSIPWLLFAGLMVFALGGGILYTLVFNRGTRRALHDLVCGTYVWQARDQAPEAPAHRLPRVHLVVLGLLTAACVLWVFAGALLVRVGEQAGLRPLIDFRQELLAQGRFTDVGVSYRTFYTSQGSTRILDVTLVGSFPDGEREALFADIETRVRANAGALPTADTLRVTLNERCDLFVASYSTTAEKRYTLNEMK